MNFAEIFNELQNCDETDRIEAKGASHGIGESFLASVSAFSNEPGLGGGYILLGVSEDFEALNHKFSITGSTTQINFSSKLLPNVENYLIFPYVP